MKKRGADGSAVACNADAARSMRAAVADVAACAARGQRDAKRRAQVKSKLHTFLFQGHGGHPYRASVQSEPGCSSSSNQSIMWLLRT